MHVEGNNPGEKSPGLLLTSNYAALIVFKLTMIKKYKIG
jgi:hypothetical protein